MDQSFKDNLKAARKNDGSVDKEIRLEAHAATASHKNSVWKSSYKFSV